jgi:hypothetical protein
MILVLRRYKQVRKISKRYNLSDLRFSFVLIATNEEPNSVREEVESTKGKQ